MAQDEHRHRSQGRSRATGPLERRARCQRRAGHPDDFIPAVPGWRERSLFITRHGVLDFFHYDPYGQVLAKLQRRHERDLLDIKSFVAAGLVQLPKLREMFALIEPELVRYPAIDPATFRQAVIGFCDEGR